MLNSKKQNIFIGLAWPYVNGDIHIGHLAGYLLPGDFFARFNRLIGNNVLMVSGADSHGTPITIEAENLKLSPKEVVDKYYAEHLKLIQKGDLSFDIYTQTTTENHKKIVQDLFLKLLNEGYIICKTTKQFYSPNENKFLPDRYVEGICPFCQNKETRSDQCDSCGKIISPEELINPISKLTQSPVILKETEHYFLDWVKLTPFLNKYYNSYKKNWREWIQAETGQWLKRGLKPTAITRDLEWGIELPIDRIPKELLIDNIESKKIYVWFEAVIGYLSASVEWDEKKYKDFWYNSKSKHYYFMGKDNLVFHTLFWPGELYAYDKKIHLPDVCAINQFLNLEGQKFSKSKGITVDAQYILDTYGSDQVRFYFTSIMPEDSDANFSWTDFQSRTNDVLISNFGNFVNRVLTLAKDIKVSDKFVLNKEISNQTIKSYKQIWNSLNTNHFKDYYTEFVNFSSFANKYISQEKPWSLKETDKSKFEEIMTNCVFLLICLDLFAKPVLTKGTVKIEEMLNISISSWPADKNLIQYIKELLTQIKINVISPLYQRIEGEQIKEEQDKLKKYQ